MTKKFDVIAKYPNLAYIEGSLTKALEENTKTISAAAEDDTIGLEDFKEIILYVAEQCKQTPYVRRFKEKVKKETSKNSLAFLVYNTALSGENLGVAS